MFRRAAWIAPALAVAGAALLPAGAQSAATTSKVTILTYVSSPAIEDFFTGYVTSKEKDCKNKREVTLYRIEDGDDAVIGTDKTSKVSGERSRRAARYGWSVPIEGAPDGVYYARIFKKKGCAADRSDNYATGAKRIGGTR